ncbi:hypothetical protein C2862_15765 [Massilia sp. Mn16-1_5]|nr:hypothetical protein C2862_15765 [Massilia sp. Mn16-1_5]
MRLAACSLLARVLFLLGDQARRLAPGVRLEGQLAQVLFGCLFLCTCFRAHLGLGVLPGGGLGLCR